MQTQWLDNKDIKVAMCLYSRSFTLAVCASYGLGVICLLPELEESRHFGIANCAKLQILFHVL